MTDKKTQSKTSMTLICLFFGGLGIHRFMMGYVGMGILQLLTFGGLGIISLIDLIRIITGSLKMKDGTELS